MSLCVSFLIRVWFCSYLIQYCWRWWSCHPSVPLLGFPCISPEARLSEVSQLGNCQKPNLPKIRGENIMFCAGWEAKVRLLAWVRAGLWVRPHCWEPEGTEVWGSWSTWWCWTPTGTLQKEPPLHHWCPWRCELEDFASWFRRESEHVWELQAGGCSPSAVRGCSYMKGGINLECGCSTGSAKLLGARLHPSHFIKARALRWIKAYGSNKADLRRWSPGGKRV